MKRWSWKKVLKRVEECVEDKEVQTFRGGRYIDSVREVYQDLMTMNVGAKNVEKVVRIVLKKLSGDDPSVKRLPKLNK